MRLFPRTARRRLLAALCRRRRWRSDALALPAGAGRGRQGPARTSRSSVQAPDRARQHDLDESQLAGCAQDAGRARAPRPELAGARADLAAAHEQAGRPPSCATSQMQAAARRRQRPSWPPPAARARRRSGRRWPTSASRLADTITAIYEQGDPQLLAFAGLLESQTTADLTRQMEFNDVVVGREDNAYDDLHAAEVLLQVRGGRGRGRPRRRRGPARRPPTDAPGHDGAGCRPREARGAEERRRSPSSQTAAAAPERPPRKARQQRPARPAARPSGREAPRQAADPRRRRGSRPGGGYTGPTNGLLHRARSTGPVTSPFGYRIHPIYDYWGLHDGTDFGVSCGEGMRAVARRHGASRTYWSDVYGNRLYLDLGPDQRQERHRRLQPRVGLPRRRRRPGQAQARSSATSARPAGRPAATCTSRSWSTAPPSTR